MTYHILNSNEPEFAAGCVGHWHGAVTAAIRKDSCVKRPELSTTEIEMPRCSMCQQQQAATKHYSNSQDTVSIESWHLKGQFNQTWTFCHYLLTLKLFQASMSLFLLLSTKEDTVKNAGKQKYYGSQWLLNY